MLALFFARGLVIGLAIAAPVGPIGVLCIRRTLSAGRAIGFVSGLGAATADACYGGVSAFGLTALSAFLTGQQFWLRLIGGVFLGYLGLRTLLASPEPETAPTREQVYRGFAGAYVSILGLTLTNPLTILSFAAIFAGIGIGAGHGGSFAAALIVAGVFTGSALWWLCLATAVSLARQHMSPTAMRWVNRISGMIIVGFGVIALASII